MKILLTALAALGQALVKPEVSDEDRQVRAFLALCVLVFAPLLFVLAVEDLVAGRMMEAVLDLILASLLMGSLAIARWASDFRWGYRIVAGGVILLLTAEIALGGGEGLAFLWAYSIPAALYFAFGVREGSGWVIGSIVLLLPAFLLDGAYDYPQKTVIRLLMTYSVVAVLALGLELSRTRLGSRLRHEEAELRSALDQVQTLAALLPLCSWCKRVRNDRGSWSRIEEYLVDQGTPVTHGLCPDCFEKMSSEERESTRDSK